MNLEYVEYDDEEYVADESQPMYAAAADQEVQTHIAEERMNGTKKAIFHISTPAGATLNQLQDTNKHGVRWTIPEELKNKLKHVTTTKNRKNASDEHLEGSINKVLILGAKVVGRGSTCPKKLTLDIDGMVPSWFHENGISNVVIPANCGDHVLERNIFEPNNMITEHMYMTNEVCNMATLKDDINLNFNKKSGSAGIRVGGVGMPELERQLLRNPKFATHADAILAKNEHMFADPQRFRDHYAIVPVEVAQAVYSTLEGPVKEIEEHYENFDKWGATFRTASKMDWNAFSDISSKTLIVGNEAHNDYLEQVVDAPFDAYVDLEIKYVLGE